MANLVIVYVKQNAENDLPTSFSIESRVFYAGLSGKDQDYRNIVLLRGTPFKQRDANA